MLHLLFGSLGFACLIGACFVIAYSCHGRTGRRGAVSSGAVGVVFTAGIAGIAGIATGAADAQRIWVAHNRLARSRFGRLVLPD